MNNIIFLGDSITDAFHNMDGANSLGRGYVRRIADRLYDDGYKGKSVMQDTTVSQQPECCGCWSMTASASAGSGFRIGWMQ